MSAAPRAVDSGRCAKTHLAYLLFRHAAFYVRLVCKDEQARTGEMLQSISDPK